MSDFLDILYISTIQGVSSNKYTFLLSSGTLPQSKTV